MSVSSELPLEAFSGRGGTTDFPPPRLPRGVRETMVLNTYWRFASERQEIFFRRLSGMAAPWTNDLILREFKFTNAYRASDRVSQYLIRRVIYAGDQDPEEVFFRTLLFKVFNRIETWELLESEAGTVSVKTYDFRRYDSILTAAMARGRRIYSAAYIMPSGGPTGEERKHRDYLRLIERMLNDRVPQRLQQSASMEQGFKTLRSYPMIGDFLAYQFITDVNYSTVTDFSEMEFVIPGPGAKGGISKCFSDIGGRTHSDLIRMMADLQEEEFGRLGLNFRSLCGRRLQLIDCQNLFCEVDKYARVAHPDVHGITGRSRIKQKYRANANPFTYWFPPKWGIRLDQEQDALSACCA
jgi:alpha-glutamyl/putrescinyl thymine pyrophosphorylase clade 1